MAILDNQSEAADTEEAKMYGILLTICFIMFAMGAVLGFTIGKSQTTPDEACVRIHVESTSPIERTR